MGEPVTRAAVTVTFLAMARPPELPASFPGGIRFARVQPCSVPFYRYLYSEIGGDYLWWMRRAETDARIEECEIEFDRRGRRSVLIRTLPSAGPKRRRNRQGRQN